MAAINFPDSPSLNDTFNVGDKTWRWDGSYWRILALPSDIDTLIKDADNDTKVQVEESADEDIIRFDVAGAQKMSLDALGLDVVDDLDVHGNITVDGQTNVGGHIIPDTDVSYDLGSATNRFRDLYLSGSSINLGGVEITSDGTNLTLPPISNISGDFTVDTSTFHVDATNNRVGIGTTSPSQALEIYVNSPEIRLTNDAVSVNSDFYYAGVTMRDSSENLAGAIGFISGEDQDMRITSYRAGASLHLVTGGASNNRITITDTGNVGIGTTSPSVSLEVSGTAQFTSASVTSATASSSLLRNITLSTSAPTGGNDGDVWMVYS